MAEAKKNKSTGKWRIQIYVGKGPNGKPMYKSFSADTKREAELKAKDYEYQQKQLDMAQKMGGSLLLLTVDVAIQQYIADRTNVCSPSTIRGYEEVYKNNIPAALKDTRVSDVTQQQIQAWVNDMATTHSPKTIRNAHGLLSATLKYAGSTLILNTRLPQKRKRDICVPDVDEVKGILKLVQGNKMYVPFLLATMCGLRASEISGLEDKNILPDRLHITQARVACKGGTALKAPKSSAGYRDIPIPDELYTILKANIKPSGRVTNMAATSISKFWSEFRTANHLPENMNFHALRHHYASKCLLLNMPQKYIAELMGHSSTNMIEQVYQHIFPSAMAEFAMKLRANTASFLSDTAQIQHKDD
ncbi:phage integrase family [Eubacterium sp. CAG:786]|nr:phage integrase family [Eubacterium sp. CAG:786]